MAKIVKETIHAKGIDIGIYTTNFENEFISLTDIAKYRNEDDPRFVIQNWMRSVLSQKQDVMAEHMPIAISPCLSRLGFLLSFSYIL